MGPVGQHRTLSTKCGSTIKLWVEFDKHLGRPRRGYAFELLSPHTTMSMLIMSWPVRPYHMAFELYPGVFVGMHISSVAPGYAYLKTCGTSGRPKP